MFFSGPLGGEISPPNTNKFKQPAGCFSLFLSQQKQSPPPPPQTTFLEKTLQIAIEVLETLQSGATGLCFIIKVWLATLTDKNTLASNRQHVCHSEGLRKFMVTCIDNISIRIKLRSVRLLCTFSSQKMLVKRKAVSYPPNIDLHKSLGSRLIIYIIVHADTSKKTSITWLWR